MIFVSKETKQKKINSTKKTILIIQQYGEKIVKKFLARIAMLNSLFLVAFSN